VVLNVEKDHLECYKNFNDLKETLFRYLDRSIIRIVNLDDKILTGYKATNMCTFAVNNKKAEYVAKKIKIKKGVITFKVYNKNKSLLQIKFKGICKHDVYNALACYCICKKLEISDEIIKKGFLKYNGVARRCEMLGTINKKYFYADYAHHPTEILSTLKAFSNMFKKREILVVFQPHTYSRTKNLFKEFIIVLKQYDTIIYKTYPARETVQDGIDSKDLAKKLKVEHYDNEYDLKSKIKKSHKKAIIFVGAGDIYSIGKKIFKSLC